MNHFSNKVANPPTLTPTSYREARQRLRAMRDEPVPEIDTATWIDPCLRFDFARLEQEDPAFAKSLLESQAENNGEFVLAPAIEKDLMRRGYIFKIVPRMEEEQSCQTSI